MTLTKVLSIMIIPFAIAACGGNVPAGVDRNSVEGSVYQELGKENNRGLPSVTMVADGDPIVVVVPSHENLTEGLTKDSARMVIRDVIKAVNGYLPGRAVRVVVTYSLVDSLGNASEDPVVAATFDGATLDSMNFDSIPLDLVLSSASNVVVHPTFGTSSDPVGSVGIPSI
jgi:hypothetical protein